MDCTFELTFATECWIQICTRKSKRLSLSWCRNNGDRIFLASLLDCMLVWLCGNNFKVKWDIQLFLLVLMNWKMRRTHLHVFMASLSNVDLHVGSWDCMSALESPKMGSMSALCGIFPPLSDETGQKNGEHFPTLGISAIHRLCRSTISCGFSMLEATQSRLV